MNSFYSPAGARPTLRWEQGIKFYFNVEPNTYVMNLHETTLRLKVVSLIEDNYNNAGETLYRVEKEIDKYTKAINETFFVEINGNKVYERDYGTTGPDHSDMVKDFEDFTYRGIINDH